jgi:sugar phosphate isomerase/epimerase
VPFAQVCDAPPGPAPTADDYMITAPRARLLPGEGVVDIDAAVGALAAIGAEPFVAFEVFNRELASQGADVMAARLRASADAYFG